MFMCERDMGRLLTCFTRALDIGGRARNLENSKYGVEIGYGADATEVFHLSSRHGQMGV